MKRLFIPLILFLLLVLEGVALELLPLSIAMSKSLIVPHWVLVCLIFIVMFYDLEDTYFSIVYGILFGLLIDIVYTNVLGVYMFSYAIVIYIIHSLKKVFHTSFYVTMFISIIGLSLTETLINVIYSFIGVADIYWKNYFIYRLLPTVLANLIFAIILYPMISKMLARWRNEQLIKTNTL